MNNLTVFFFSLMDFNAESETATLHTGLTAAHTAEDVREELLFNVCDPRHISVVEVPELQPVLDGDGCLLGFTTRPMPDENCPQAVSESVENMEGAGNEPQV